MSDDKTEEPTPKRLRKAQEEGNSPISSFASQAIAFLVAVAIAPAAIGALTTQAAKDIRSAIAQAANPTPRIDFDPFYVGLSVVILAAPILGAAAVSAAVLSVVQSGGVIATKKLLPKLDNLNIINGFKGLFSLQRIVGILRAALFGSGVGYFTYLIIRGHLVDLGRTTGQLEQVGVVASSMARSMALRAAMLGIFLAVIDIVVTYNSWKKKLRMSKDEVKREYKESEGDPQIKAARERAHQELLNSATVANVKNATVVVVNPTHIACALRYDESGGDDAPVVVASGQGDLAARMIEAARQYGIPVLRDVPLARALVELEVGVAIPEALYEAVAEILREAWEESEREGLAVGPPIDG
ncbi:MAG: EscU/YscU/HrcU family type III secretion system export apparatus switch protein [Polyangiaceae bacterium]|nr:EscU/YscU/HrcU family type III secretion system export apparatus switch protein [Polyangiaceae bacterium]